MTRTKKTLVAWSSGKDSAWALHVLRNTPGVEVAGLFTTVREGGGRVPVHEVSSQLLEAQARSAGLPLHCVPLPDPCSNAEYEARIRGFLERQRSDATAIAFGDLFLEDIRRYREQQFAASGLELLFPLWGRPTRELAEDMIAGGLGARVVSVDTRQAPRELAGRLFDAEFLHRLSPHVDPCGERGEFHTFAFAGPMFANAVEIRVGAITEAKGYAFAEVLPW